jgi:hypothetical protein
VKVGNIVENASENVSDAESVVMLVGRYMPIVTSLQSRLMYDSYRMPLAVFNYLCYYLPRVSLESWNHRIVAADHEILPPAPRTAAFSLRLVSTSIMRDAPIPFPEN